MEENLILGMTFTKVGIVPQRNDYERSPEAIYQLRVKPNTQVDLRLDSRLLI